MKSNQGTKTERVKDLLKTGYPSYTTQVGWLGYTDEGTRKLCRDYLAKGFTGFKVKVGQNLENDRRRCKLVREEIGWDNKLVSNAYVLYLFIYFI